jgi:hypothetical protein
MMPHEIWTSRGNVDFRDGFERNGEIRRRYRRPADGSKAKQWGAAVDTLLGILNGYQEWRDNMPAGVSDSAAAQRFDDVLALRDLVEQLQGVDLPTFPKSFGRN